MTPRRGAALACLVVLAGGAPARADDTNDIQSLLNEHVITTASATAQRDTVAPALSTTITAEDIQRLGIRSLAEAINYLSLGVVTADPLGTPDIGSRGVMLENDNGKHVLLLINGHAINDPLYGAARFDQGAGVPIDLVDHIEVVVGPGSVLYGSNAMMGVINVITKSASDYSGVHALADDEFGRSFRVGGGAGVAFQMFGAPSELTASVEYYQRYGPSLTLPQQQYQLGGSFSHLSFGQGLPENVWGGTVDKAYYTQAPSALLRLRSGDFDINVFANTYLRGIPYASAFENVEFNDPKSYELDRSLRIDVKHQATISTIAQLTSRLYGDSFDYQRRLNVEAEINCLRGDLQVCQYYDVGAARWVGLEERLSLNWFRDQSFVTMLGVDARERWVGAKEDVVDDLTGKPIDPTSGRIDQTGLLVSPYAQQTYSPTSRVDLNAGARLDIDSRFSPVVSPRGAVSVRPFEKTTVKLIYSQAFRAPTWSETSIADYEVAPSPGLQPEIVRSVEASIEQKFATQRLLFGVFRSWWTNLIESVPVSTAELAQLQTAKIEPEIVPNLQQYENIARIDNFGWNGGWEGSLVERRLRYALNVTGAYTRLNQGGQSVAPPVAPQIFGNVRVSYAAGGLVPTPALAMFVMGPRPAESDGGRRKPVARGTCARGAPRCRERAPPDRARGQLHRDRRLHDRGPRPVHGRPELFGIPNRLARVGPVAGICAHRSVPRDGRASVRLPGSADGGLAMRISPAITFVLISAVLAGACVNLSPVPYEGPEGGVSDASLPDALFDVVIADGPGAACAECLAMECASQETACDRDMKCSAFAACWTVTQCWGSSLMDLNNLAPCIGQCGIAAHIASQTDPALGPFTALLSCAQDPTFCASACVPAPDE